MPKYLVETVSIFRMRYVVDAKEANHAADEVVMRLDFEDDKNALQEFSQKHVDEVITSVRSISKKEYLRVFDEDNAYLADWPEERKFKYINKIDYDAE